MILPPRKAAKFLPRALFAALRYGGFFTAAALFAGGGTAAFAVDLSGDPYVKSAPYQPPPLPPIVNSPSSRQAGYGSKADNALPYAPPSVTYRPKRGLNPGKAARHEQWCLQNHPSYRPTDNSYRPFDKAGTMPPQARVRCVSP